MLLGLFAVGCDGGVDGQGSLLNGCHIGDVDGRACLRGLYYQMSKLICVVHLRTDEAQDQLMIGFVEAGRIHDIGSLDCIHKIGNGDTSGGKKRKVGNDVELGNLAALDRYGAHAGDAIEGRLQVVGGDLPQPGLRDSVGGEAIAEDGESRKCEPVRRDARGRGKCLLHLTQRCIDQL